MILPEDNVVGALGGILIVLVALSLGLKSYRKKQSEKKLDRRVSGIKRQFSDIKDESIIHEEDDWLEMRLKEDSDMWKRQ